MNNKDQKIIISLHPLSGTVWDSHSCFLSQLLLTAMWLCRHLGSSGSSALWMRTPPSSLSTGFPVGPQSLLLAGSLESGVSPCNFHLAQHLGLLVRSEQRGSLSCLLTLAPGCILPPLAPGFFVFLGTPLVCHSLCFLLHAGNTFF